MYQYRVTCVRFIDGDTFIGDIDLGFDLSLKNQHCRLDGIDAPEKNTEAGQRALEYAKKWVANVEDSHRELYVTVKAKNDKYGRRLVVLYGCETGLSLNLLLRDENMAVAYDGRSKRGVTNVERKEDQP